MQDALARIIELFVNNLELRQPPETIYHYTNDVGLRGILGTGKLWLTNIFKLNDPSEWRHGFEIGTKVLGEAVANDPPESRELARRLSTRVERGNFESIAYIFVCSFSSSRDDLCQWRAYADNGRGYVLGFDATALKSGFTGGMLAPNSARDLFPITYEDDRLARLDREIIGEWRRLVSLRRQGNLSGAEINSYENDTKVQLLAHLGQAASLFKHQAYSNEKEYRLLVTYSIDASPPLKFRNRPYSLVAYTEFDWRHAAPNALREIVVGPAADHQKASQFAEDCLRLFNFNPKTVPITCSPIPYRAV